MKKIAGFALFFLFPALLTSQDRQFNFFIEESDDQTRFIIRTVELFPCHNYEIRLFHHVYNDTLFVDIKEYVAPMPCVGGMDVAMAQRSVAKIASDSFAVVIRWSGKTDHWRVRRHSGRLSGEGIRPQFTSWFR